MNIKTLLLAYLTMILPITGFGQANETTSSLDASLLYFQVTIIDAELILKWGTESHTAGEHISVEKSENGIDFEEIRRIEINGDINTEQDYSVNDTDVHEGTSYYRLKQSFPDGGFNYSESLFISCRKNRIADIELYPVPAKADRSEGFFSSEFIIQDRVDDPQQPITSTQH